MMRLKNTSRYPTEEIRALVAFGMKGVDTTGVQVNVKNCSGSYRGRAYNGVPSISPASRKETVSYLITLGIGTTDKFPVVNHRSRHFKTVPEQQINDWREAIVRCSAHEARHIHQFRHSKPRSEVDCERFAAKRLEEFRAQEGGAS